MSGVELTGRESELLLRVAQGASYRQLAREWSVTEIAVRGYGHRLLRKLDAKSIAHAVHLAHCRGLLAPREDCGDRAAYLRHIRRGETPDPACRAANARHGVEQRAGLLAAGVA